MEVDINLYNPRKNGYQLFFLSSICGVFVFFSTICIHMFWYVSFTQTKHMLIQNVDSYEYKS